ncbi:MAG: glycosyltransferase [Actinobacteria bacterium]|nr:MAG: glycosyltransferase [Actinomycetota bacterium]
MIPPAMRSEVSVVVPSHERPLRLLWLLNALEEQTIPPDRWELIVVHDSRSEDTVSLLREHPLAKRVSLRERRLPPGSGPAPRQRNVGWRMASGPCVAFTDDDCRPEPDWLEALLAASRANPGAIVQGATRADPFEADVLAAPHHRTIVVDPPGPFGQTCNILYPREVLEQMGGFDELLASSGEDADLLWRARAAGAAHVGARDAVVNHAVESFTAVGMARLSWKWRDLPAVVGRHEELRRRFPLGGRLWRARHGWLLLAIGGMAAMGRRPGAALLAAPYLRTLLDPVHPYPRSQLRRALELPGHAAVDAAELAALAAGSVRHKSLFL